ncbi:MAG: hypothetical protein ACTSYR_01675 [Candidatus Odinarchaeia archaeon]
MSALFSQADKRTFGMKKYEYFSSHPHPIGRGLPAEKIKTMRSPECAICGKGGTCKLVYFKLRPQDEEWYKKMEEIGGVGHPPEAEWFCEKHYKRAVELKNLTIDEAFKILLKEFKKDK